MRKSWIWVILLVALLLVGACRPEVEEPESSSSDASSTEDLGVCQPEEDCEDEPGEDEAPTEEAAEPTVAPVEETDSAPSEAPVVPADDPLAVQDGDWTMGPDDAFMTIIEYGDFQ